jgi:hypothetical protein
MGPTDEDDVRSQPEDESSDPVELQVVSTSRWLVLAETRDGYGIWRRDDDRSGPPIAEFGEDAEGFASADREFRRRVRMIRLFATVPTVLSWCVAVGVCVWVLTGLYLTLWTMSLLPRSFEEQMGGPPTFVSAAGTMSYDIWVGALAVLIMLWLLRRTREDPVG